MKIIIPFEHIADVQDALRERMSLEPPLASAVIEPTKKTPPLGTRSGFKSIGTRDKR